jgi:hypothetical protein
MEIPSYSNYSVQFAVSPAGCAIGKNPQTWRVRTLQHRKPRLHSGKGRSDRGSSIVASPFERPMPAGVVCPSHGLAAAQGFIVLATRKPRVLNWTLILRLKRTDARICSLSLRQEPPRTTR